MLRAHLTDGALAAAKAWAHAHAEPRHVCYAIARHFRDRAEVAELESRAKQALEPRGEAIDVPSLTEEAAALIESIASAEDAVTSLRRILDGGAPVVGAEDAARGGAPAGSEGAPATGGGPSTVPPQQAAAAPAESVRDVLTELAQLIGLDSVKQQVRQVVAVVQANQERAKGGLATVNPGLHLVFTGAPGTGKTTVARLVARLYAASGALPGSNFTEVDRSDLVAGYVGQTALKTAEVVRKTLPGVLFIDEAYALTPSHASDYGAEAIATLVKAMEDHRHELAVIVAGYSDEMVGFLESNPGLRSRLRTFVAFPDYAPKELVEIFANLVNTTGLGLAGDVLEKAEGLFERAVNRTDFGNARFARSLFEQAFARMALRAAEDGDVRVDELMELTAADLEWNEPGVEVADRRIGFGKSASEDEDNKSP